MKRDITPLSNFKCGVAFFGGRNFIFLMCRFSHCISNSIFKMALQGKSDTPANLVLALHRPPLFSKKRNIWTMDYVVDLGTYADIRTNGVEPWLNRLAQLGLVEVLGREMGKAEKVAKNRAGQTSLSDCGLE